MAVVHEYYPSSFKKAVCFYSLIEKLFVFAVKRKLRCTLGLIHSLYISFDTSKTHLEHTDDIFLAEFRVLSALCPLGIQLAQVINREDTDSEGMAQHTQQITLSDIELSFPLFSGCSPSQSKKRHKMLETAIDEYLKKEYLEHSDKEMIKKHSFTSIKKNGWPAGFDCEVIELPVPPKMLNELSSMQPPSIVSVSVPNSDASSIVQDMDSTVKDEEDSAETSMESSLDFLVDKSGKDSISLTALGGGHKVLDRLKAQLSYRDQITHIETIEGRPASFRELVCSPSSFIDKKLLLLVGERIGVKRFYAHQAQAINHILEGKHVVVSTATSSGKSIIYNLPIISAVLQNSKVTAMYLFPTKVCCSSAQPLVTLLMHCISFFPLFPPILPPFLSSYLPIFLLSLLTSFLPPSPPFPSMQLLTDHESDLLSCFLITYRLSHRIS
jgi:DEAD/DEAH box helicase